LWRYFPHEDSCVEPLLTKMVDAFCRTASAIRRHAQAVSAWWMFVLTRLRVRGVAGGVVAGLLIATLDLEVIGRTTRGSGRCRGAQPPTGAELRKSAKAF
jgi:hypothetical protein